MGDQGDIFKPTTDDFNYDINQHANDTLGPVDVQQVVASLQPANASKDQRSPETQQGNQFAQAGGDEIPETSHINQSTGERARTPNYDESVREGVAVSDRVRRGIQRADYALAQTAKGERDKWAYRPSLLSRPYSKCNEFVNDAHVYGDPQGSRYPTVPREKPEYYKPTVDNLADPNFAKDALEYQQNSSTPWKGDTIVWYDGKGTHHCGIALGNGEVAYASTDGSMINTIDNATSKLNNVHQIIRRLK